MNSNAQQNALILLGQDDNCKRQSGLNLKLNSRLLLVVLGVCLSVLWWPITIFLAVIYLIKTIFDKIKIKQRSSKLEKDLPAFLVALGSSIRCGLDPLQALLSTQELFLENSEIFKAIRKSKNEIKQGDSLDEVIANFAVEVDYPDLQLFRDVFSLAKDQGSGISGALSRIAKFIRNRQSFRRKTRAALAMQKLSAVGIFLTVLILFLIQIVSNHEILLRTWQHDLGAKLMIVSGCLILLGLSSVFLINNSESS